MNARARIRLAILSLAAGMLLYWAWGDLSDAAGVAATSVSYSGLDAARAELSRYHCDGDLDALGGCVRWRWPYYQPGEDVAFYDRHRALFDDRAAHERGQQRAAARHLALLELAPVARKAILIAAIAVAAMLLVPFISRKTV